MQTDFTDVMQFHKTHSRPPCPLSFITENTWCISLNFSSLYLDNFLCLNLENLRITQSTGWSSHAKTKVMPKQPHNFPTSILLFDVLKLQSPFWAPHPQKRQRINLRVAIQSQSLSCLIMQEQGGDNKVISTSVKNKLSQENEKLSRSAAGHKEQE